MQVQFLKKAVDILCSCRVTLMYTYVFAYYLRKNNQSAIFEVSTALSRSSCTIIVIRYAVVCYTCYAIVDGLFYTASFTDIHA